MKINKRMMSIFLIFTFIFTTSITMYRPKTAHANVLALPLLTIGGGEIAGVGALSALSGPGVLVVGTVLAGYYGYQNKEYLLYKAQQTWDVLDSSTRTAIQALADGADTTITMGKDLIDKIDSAYLQANQGITQETLQLTMWGDYQLVRFSRSSNNSYSTAYKQYSIGKSFSLNSETTFSVKETEPGTIALFRDGVQVKTDFDTNTFTLGSTAFNIYYPSGWDTASVSDFKDYFVIPTISASTGRPGLTVLYEDPWTLGTYREFTTVYPRDISAESTVYTTPTTKTKDLTFSATNTVSVPVSDIKATSLNPAITATGAGTATGTDTSILGSLKDAIISALSYLFIPNKALITNKFVDVKTNLETKYNSDLDIIKSLNDTPDRFEDIKINTGSLSFGNNINGGGSVVTIVSAKAVNDHIDFIRIVTSMFWMFLLLVYVYNQIYFLIRATYPIAGPSGGGSFSAPSVDSGGGDNKMGSYSSGSFRQGRR